MKKNHLGNCEVNNMIVAAYTEDAQHSYCLNCISLKYTNNLNILFCFFHKL